MKLFSVLNISSHAPARVACDIAAVSVTAVTADTVVAMHWLDIKAILKGNTAGGRD
jgi:hypothetical protein